LHLPLAVDSLGNSETDLGCHALAIARSSLELRRVIGAKLIHAFISERVVVTLYKSVQGQLLPKISRVNSFSLTSLN
jgi:hypothetical protein